MADALRESNDAIDFAAVGAAPEIALETAKPREKAAKKKRKSTEKETTGAEGVFPSEPTKKKKKKKKKSVSAEEDADAVPKENVVADDTTSPTQDPESRFSACLPCGSKPLTRVKRSDGLFPCHEYDQNGTCKFGDKCKFSHLGVNDPGVQKSRRRSDGLMPCREWDENGTCGFGDSCKFSHLGTDDPGLPDYVPMKKKGKKMSKPCFMFREGNCKYGEECRYSHDDAAPKKEAHEDAYLIGRCLLGKFTQEEKLKNIASLPERLKAKARKMFFAKQKLGHFVGHGPQASETQHDSESYSAEGQWSAGNEQWSEGQSSEGQSWQ